MIVDGRIKAKLDKEKESIMFDTHEQKVDIMVNELQKQTLKIIKSMECLEEADLELIKQRKESLFAVGPKGDTAA